MITNQQQGEVPPGIVAFKTYTGKIDVFQNAFIPYEMFVTEHLKDVLPVSTIHTIQVDGKQFSVDEWVIFKSRQEQIEEFKWNNYVGWTFRPKAFTGFYAIDQASKLPSASTGREQTNASWPFVDTANSEAVKQASNRSPEFQAIVDNNFAPGKEPFLLDQQQVQEMGHNERQEYYAQLKPKEPDPKVESEGKGWSNQDILNWNKKTPSPNQQDEKIYTEKEFTEKLDLYRSYMEASDPRIEEHDIAQEKVWMKFIDKWQPGQINSGLGEALEAKFNAMSNKNSEWTRVKVIELLKWIGYEDHYMSAGHFFDKEAIMKQPEELLAEFKSSPLNQVK